MVLARLRAISFERTVLTIVGASIAALYAVALSEKFGPIVEDRVVPPATFRPAGTDAEPATEVSTVQELEAAFERVDYRLANVWGDGLQVPRLFVRSIPEDLDKVQLVSERKRLFIRAILPLVLHVNETILADRAMLAALHARLVRGAAPLSAREQVWIRRLRQRYGVEDGSWGELFRRVDIVPPSLAIAQAAIESGWGSSRFAREGNAVFGQWTFTPGAGMVPLRRDEDKSHEVKRFSGLLESVADYVMNLNRHPAYKEFRATREALRTTEGVLDGYELAGMLTRYSAKGPAYVRAIRTIIRVNVLQALDRAHLEDRAAVHAERPDV